MCISSGPAHFSKTKILTMPLGKLHFTAYQNSAENLSNKPNSMILPIPGKTSPEMFVDTSAYNKFLNEIVEAKKPRTRGAKGIYVDSFGSFQKFDLGQYTIGLTDSLQGMQDFLKSVPEEKRATISDDLLQFFATHYSGWSFAVCLFSASAKMESQPIAYTYEPFVYNILFFPTMDSHDGQAPKKLPELMDHSFIMPTTGQASNFFTQDVPDFIKSQNYQVIEFHDDVLGETNGDVYVTNGVLDKIYDFKKFTAIVKD